MINLLNKIVFFILSFFYVISYAYAIDFIYDSNTKITLPEKILGQKVSQFDVSPYIGRIIFNNDIKLKTILNESLKIINRINNEIHFNRTNLKKIFVLSKLKLGYIKITHDKFGSISYGKHYGVIRDVIKVSNVTPSYNNENNKFDHFMYNRANRLLSYKNKSFFGLAKNLKFKIQYQGCNPTKYLSAKRKLINFGNNQGFGVFVSYNINDDLILSGSYFKSERTFDQIIIDVDQFDNRYAVAYAISMKYETDKLYLSAVHETNYFMTPYGNIDNTGIRELFESKSILRDFYYCGYAPKSETLELVYKYKLKYGFEYHLAYFKTFCQYVKNDLNQYLTNFLSCGLRYTYNKNVSTFIDYKINFIDLDEFTFRSNINTDNALSIGISYKF